MLRESGVVRYMRKKTENFNFKLMQQLLMVTPLTEHVKDEDEAP